MTISLNENLKTRRKQLAILAAVIIGGAAAAGGVMWYGQYQQKQKQPAPAATPNLTGVVTATFNEQVNDAALTQQQAKTSALEQNLATLAQQFAQNKLTTEQKLAEKDAEIQRLNDQLTKAPAATRPLASRHHLQVRTEHHSPVPLLPVRPDHPNTM
jgi:conjugal transfer pilus assembly protein TraB